MLDTLSPLRLVRLVASLSFLGQGRGCFRVVFDVWKTNRFHVEQMSTLVRDSELDVYASGDALINLPFAQWNADATPASFRSCSLSDEARDVEDFVDSRTRSAATNSDEIWKDLRNLNPKVRK